MSDLDAESVVDRITELFDGSPGGPFQLWSAWPTPDLSLFGFVPWGVPLMIREAGGEARPAPAGLEIAEAASLERLERIAPISVGIA